MSAELSEMDRDTDKQERIRKYRYKREVRDRGCSSVPGEGECEREKNDGEIQMWERGEREQELDGRRGEKVQDVPRGERDDRRHVERMRREILSEDGREIGWMKEIWEKEGKDREREGWG
jgi:hypothetical protein